MTEKDLIKQLKSLQEIKPSEDWSVSARESLINHIDASIENAQPVPATHKLQMLSDRLGALGKKAFAQTTWAMAGAFAIVLGLVAGVFLTPGVDTNVASEDLYKNGLALEASFAESMKKAEEVAAQKLTKEDAEFVAEKFETYKNNVEEAKTSGDGEKLEQAVTVAEKESEALTSAISETTETVTLAENLRNKTEERLASCEDETLTDEVTELLEEGGVRSLIDAHLLSLKCADIPPAEADAGLENAVEEENTDE